MYYHLQKHCVLVEGKSRGAIYNFKEGKVFSINGSAITLLKECREKKINDIFDINLHDNKIYLAFLDNLSAKSLGSFYACRQDFVEEEKRKRYFQEKKSDDLNAPLKLQFLWLELTNACNNRCLHCYSESSPALLSDSLPHEKWLSIIDEAADLGATAIQLIGGEPLLYHKWMDLAKRARDRSFSNIEIFTNATLIREDDLDFCKKHKISLATTIYADNAQIHDAITLNPGSFKKTMEAIEKILKADIPLRITSIIMRDNESQVENIAALYQKLGVEAVLPDVVRPTGRGEDEKILPRAYRKPPIKPPFYTDEESFLQARKYHDCLAGKIAVTATGDVIPCIFARELVCANITNSSLAEVLKSPSLKDCWHTTKDCVEKCQECEYRYACMDCRPLAQSFSTEKNWLAHPPSCSYNPHTGVWS